MTLESESKVSVFLDIRVDQLSSGIGSRNGMVREEKHHSLRPLEANRYIQVLESPPRAPSESLIALAFDASTMAVPIRKK